ncbi:hypothetical protein B4087_1129 [Bacillus cereus]|uniref:YopX family protein n=1 Tax=Bacillus cereus TaxID=1396 RepID=UPI00062D8D3E|nr:YopX family protein [Bacillus cereus]KLA16179.1 hypothetical protein B4087_1129 [Bacillus cereus]KMP68384.1 phage protein [Bacillus cereus]
MRGIKFRAWDGDRMQTVLTLGLYEGFVSTNKLHSDVEDFKLMQYTGLKDKNGKKIFEGDILDLSLDDDSVLRCEIVYQAPSFCRKWHNANTIRLRQREIEPLAWNTHIVYEVIGNIYENPELLEESK